MRAFSRNTILIDSIFDPVSIGIYLPFGPIVGPSHLLADVFSEVLPLDAFFLRIFHVAHEFGCACSELFLCGGHRWRVVVDSEECSVLEDFFLLFDRRLSLLVGFLLCFLLSHNPKHFSLNASLFRGGSFLGDLFWIFVFLFLKLALFIQPGLFLDAVGIFLDLFLCLSMLFDGDIEDSVVIWSTLSEYFKGSLCLHCALLAFVGVDDLVNLGTELPLLGDCILQVIEVCRTQ